MRLGETEKGVFERFLSDAERSGLFIGRCGCSLVCPGFPLPEGKCLNLVRPLYGLVQAPLAFYRLVKQVYTTKCNWDNCRAINTSSFAWRIISNLVALFSSMTLLDNVFFQQFDSDFVPPSNRIYPSCQYSLAILILVVYVDNNAARFNCDELLEEFQRDVMKSRWSDSA